MARRNPKVSGARHLDLVDIQMTGWGGTISVRGGGKTPISIVTVFGAQCGRGVFLGIRAGTRVSIENPEEYFNTG